MANWVRKWWSVSVGTGLLAVIGFAAGCSLESTPKGGSKAGQKSGDKDDHDHDHDHDGHDHHDHDHAHMHGPNGGPVLELGDEEYHAEWLHDDESGKVTVVLQPRDIIPQGIYLGHKPRNLFVGHNDGMAFGHMFRKLILQSVNKLFGT